VEFLQPFFLLCLQEKLNGLSKEVKMEESILFHKSRFLVRVFKR